MADQQRQGPVGDGSLAQPVELLGNVSGLGAVIDGLHVLGFPLDFALMLVA